MTEENDLSFTTQGRDAVHCVSTRRAGDLNVNIYADRQAMGADAANMVCNQINALLNWQDFVNMIFAAAPSQNEFLSKLIQNKTVNWGRINAFHMDEYTGLPENDPRLFSSFLKEKIFRRVRFSCVNYINGNAADVNGECFRYAELLKNNPPDIVCMGIGENGHIAFNDPPVANFNDPEKVKMVSLDSECRQQQVNDGCFNTIEEVPTHAITLTVPALMAGKYIYCMVPGVKKAKAVYNTLNEAIIDKFPSTILRRHPNAVLFLDGDSSSMLEKN